MCFHGDTKYPTMSINDHIYMKVEARLSGKKRNRLGKYPQHIQYMNKTFYETGQCVQYMYMNKKSVSMILET